MGKNLDAKQLKREADALSQAAARHGENLVAKASTLAEEGVDWVAPRAQKLWDETVKVAAPRIEDAVDKARPYIDNVHEKVVEDYLPRIENAAREAHKAASGSGTVVERASRAGKATSKALTKPAKRHTFAKVFGWTTLAAVAAGAGYILWRRSQPVEDPWAEEYWADLDTDVEIPETPAEPVDEA